MRRYEGNYSIFLEQKIIEERNNEKNEQDKIVIDTKDKGGSKIKIKTKKHMKRLSYKEAKELKELEHKLPLLEEQKIYLEKKINHSDTDITKISHELAELMESIQEYEDRWIELSELPESSK